ncbi:shikimate kinase [Rhodohalobacter sp. 614A]|uniref:shikimate kinase n=1 Tax=Rhodohalobacter sp. 614A TaxID=2908649 RepID=UPI001F17CE9E|nr:shikimate kinase [Rhodohalobacter sp. 614A]
MNRKTISHPVFLCGMMGSGKSTIGKQLAEDLEVPFTDLDELIEESEKMTIPEIFNRKGEKRFREIEKQQIVKIAGSVEGVVALGGGSLQNQQIVDHLKLYGWLVYIDASQVEILNRLSDTTGRPMLENSVELEQRISTLFDQRMQFYEQAHFSIQTEKKSVEQVTTEIVKKLKIYEGRDYH